MRLLRKVLHMNSISLKRLIIGAGVCAALSAYAGWAIKGEPTVAFTAQGNIGLKFDGTTHKVGVTDDGKNVSVTISLKDLDTGVGLRNRHMQEDTEAEKFPDVTLAMPSEAIKALEDGKSPEGQGKGSLTLHGKTKEQAFAYKVVCKGGSCNIEANGTINLKDFDIKPRSYMGVTVKPDVAIRAAFTIAK